MQKFVKVLEKNAEWIAMGIAGLWLLWVVWAYILAPPTVEVANEKRTASEIDDLIFDTPAAQLKAKIHDTSKPLEIPVVEYVSSFDARMRSLPTITPGANPFGSKGPGTVLVGDPRGPETLQKDALLPAVPIVKDPLTSSGRSVIQPEPPPVIVDPNKPAPPVGVQQVLAPMDKIWITVPGLFNQTELVKAYEAAKIPQFLLDIVILEVQLERREVLADNKFGPAVRVPGLPINRAIDPATGETWDLKTTPDEYLEWARTKQAEILQPRFYSVLGGDLWQPNIPGMVPIVNVNQPLPQAGPGVDPNVVDGQALLQIYKSLPTLKERTAFQNSLPTSKHKAALYKAIQDDEKRNQPPPNQPNPNPRPGARPPAVTPGVVPPRAQNNAADAELFREALAQARPGEDDKDRFMREQREQRERNNRAERGGRPGVVQPGVIPGRPFGDGFPQPMNPGFPQPQPMNPGFAPGINPDANGNVPVWAHDETGQPGKTYQYRLRVVIKNPLYNTKEVAKNEADAKIVALPSDPAASWSEWTKSVTIPVNLKFWLASARGGNDPKATFKIRKWEQGKANVSPDVIATPGDMVGGVIAAPAAPVAPPVPAVPAAKPAAIDFTTGWTVVDIRAIGDKDYRVTLINDAGETLVRSLKEDQASAERENAAPPAAIGGITN